MLSTTYPSPTLPNGIACTFSHFLASSSTLRRTASRLHFMSLMFRSGLITEQVMGTVLISVSLLTSASATISSLVSSPILFLGISTVTLTRSVPSRTS